MTTRDEQNLLQTYVRRRWLVSTALRRSSSIHHSDFQYYETWAWPQCKRTGKTVEKDENGIKAFLVGGMWTEEKAIAQHMSVVRSLLKKCPPCKMNWDENFERYEEATEPSCADGRRSRDAEAAR